MMAVCGAAPVVLLTGHADGGSSSACLPHTPSPAAARFALRLQAHDGSWERGRASWLAVEVERLPQLMPGAACGVACVNADGECSVSFPEPFTAAPTLILTAQGERGKATACLLPNQLWSSAADGFSARLRHYDGSAERGKVHWIAIPPPPS